MKHGEVITGKVSAQQVRELFHYDAISGVFTRISPRAGKTGRVGRAAGSVNKHGYVRISIGGRKYMAHQLAWLYMTGEWIKEVDHRNRNRSDNRWSNLRPATRTQNRFNLTPYKNNRTGYKGVCFSKERRMFTAATQVDGKRYYLGAFATSEEAARAYDAAVLERVGDFAVLNFPEGRK